MPVVTPSSFVARINEEEITRNTAHITETIGYVAIYNSLPSGTAEFNGVSFDYTLSNGSLKHQWKTLEGYSLKVEEEQSKDNEIRHITETIDLLLTNDLMFAQDVLTKGGDSSSIRRNTESPIVAGNEVIQSNIYYYHNDHLGTPKTLTDENQSIVWQASYTPFGKATVSIETIENNIRFPGQYFDQETGLHYNYFRDYDPEIGRYIQSDPIGLNGGVSTYGYAYQNPITNIDPFGLEVTGEWVKEPELNNVSATPICDANGQCGTNAPFPPKIKGILPPKVYAGSVQFNVKATVDWVILCKDSEDCGETEEWLLTGGNQLNNNVSIPIWVPLFSHPVLTAYNIANLGEQAIDQSIKHFDEAVMLYKGSIDPTNWCIVMPRR